MNASGRSLSACTAVEPAGSARADGARARPSTFATPPLGLLSDAVGGASRTPALRSGAVEAHGRVSSPRAAPLDRVGKLVGRLPGMPRAMSRLRAWRNHGRTQLARWAELGRREQADSRSLGRRRAHRAAREHARTRLREPGRQGRHPGAEPGDRGDRRGRAARALRARRQPGGTDRGPPVRRWPNPRTR